MASLTLLVSILLSFDFALFHVMDIVSRHTVTQFNLISKHTHTFHAHTKRSFGFSLIYNSAHSLQVITRWTSEWAETP